MKVEMPPWVEDELEQVRSWSERMVRDRVKYNIRQLGARLGSDRSCSSCGYVKCSCPKEVYETGGRRTGKMERLRQASKDAETPWASDVYPCGPWKANIYMTLLCYRSSLDERWVYVEVMSDFTWRVWTRDGWEAHAAEASLEAAKAACDARLREGDES